MQQIASFNHTYFSSIASKPACDMHGHKMKLIKRDIKKIWNLKIENNTEGSLRRKAVKGFALFFILISVFTVLSRAADSMTIPKVVTTYPSKKNLEFAVSATGKIEQNQDQAISTLANVKIDSIYVNEGQKVSAGDSLFQLSMKDLESKKEALEYDLAKLELNLEEITSQAKVTENDNATALERANENYGNTASKVGTEVVNAYNAMIKANKKLVDFQNTASGAEEESVTQVLQVLQNTLVEKEASLANAKAALESTAAQIDQLVVQKKADEQQKLDEANADKSSATGGVAETQTITSTSLSQEELASIEAAVRLENQYLLEKANEAIAAAEAGKADAQAALSNYQANTARDSAQSRSTEEETLSNDYESKKQTYESVVQSSNLSVLEVERAIEDATKEKAVSNSIEEKQLEIDSKNMDLEEITALIEQSGTITTPVDGVVTKNAITVGAVTPDSAAMLLADTSSGSKFVAQLSLEQQKYISRNDTVTLKTADRKTTVNNLNVDLLTTNAEDSSLMDITILLPNGELEIGTTATLEFTKTTATYNCCVPIEAIHTDSYGKTYVFTMKEVETVLGTELQVVRTDVEIQDKNEKYAALADGSLLDTDEIITSSNKTINAGDRVRLAEE